MNALHYEEIGVIYKTFFWSGASNLYMGDFLFGGGCGTAQGPFPTDVGFFVGGEAERFGTVPYGREWDDRFLGWWWSRFVQARTGGRFFVGVVGGVHSMRGWGCEDK